jgi:hypothetical protein
MDPNAFPSVEAFLSEENPPLLEAIRRTCTSLDTVRKTGTASERQRAQAAMNAYGRTLDLTRDVRDIYMKSQREHAESR